MQSEINKLIGIEVTVEISEPWEISVALDQLMIKAVIEKVDNLEMLLRLHFPIKIKEKLCNYLIASKRYESDTIHDILHKKRFVVAITPIFLEPTEESDPFELSSKHRGSGLIGTLLLINNLVS